MEDTVSFPAESPEPMVVHLEDSAEPDVQVPVSIPAEPVVGTENTTEPDVPVQEDSTAQEDATTPTTQSSWCPEYLNLTNEPIQITGAWKEFSQTPSNYTRGCFWSPDGYYLMTNSKDNCLRLFNLPSVLYQAEVDWSDIGEMNAVVKITEGDIIYDCCWYPLMNTWDPSTCCLATCFRRGPVHLWDAFTAELRATYSPYNHLDEIESPISVSFNPDGSKIMCGFRKCIRVFDTAAPGRECTELATKTTGHLGIVSCLAANPAMPEIYGAGSFLKSIGLISFDENRVVCFLRGQKSGVTSLRFSPDGLRLYSGGRKDSEIICWDLRNPGETLFTLNRKVDTNQRIYFDLDSSGRYFVTGNTDGHVKLWDLAEITDDPKATVDFSAHSDCVNGVSLHPSLPLIASSSGQRQYPGLADSSDDEDETTFGDLGQYDNSLRLWWLGKST